MRIKRDVVHLDCGLQIESVTMTNKMGMEAEVLSLGGIIKSLKVPDKDGNFENVLVELKDINGYVENPGYFNALIGRTAGRVNKGEFTLGDVKYKANNNEGEHTLHGGISGFDKKIWGIRDVSQGSSASIELYTFSPHGEEGYPGNLDIIVKYTLEDDNSFTIEYMAIPDRDTLVNMTNHAYFNLSGDCKRPITDEILMINGSYICELDFESIATGKTLDVSEHTPFDFREPKPIGRDIEDKHTQLEIVNGYDHPWVLDKDGKADAILYDPLSGRYLEISTDQNLVVMYTMNNRCPLELTNGQKDVSRYGITFETQGYPIGHNESFKEGNIVKAREKYTQTTKWRFDIR